MIGFEDLAARQKQWAAFIADPERIEIFAETEKDGPLVHHLENRMMSPPTSRPSPSRGCGASAVSGGADGFVVMSFAPWRDRPRGR